jgi:GntR family transcriptional regulator
MGGIQKDLPMTLSEHDPTLRRYHNIEAALRDGILSGRLPVGSCLPTEHDLTRSFSVSRFTVRRAITRLRDKGLVASRRGLGTFVIANREGDGFVQSLASLEELLQYPEGTKRETLSIVAAQAIGEPASQLDNPQATEWVQLRAVRRLRSTGQAIGFIEAWVAAQFADVLSQPNPQSLAVLQQIEDLHGQRAFNAEIQIASGGLSADIADHLDAELGAPALVIHRRYRGEDGRVYLLTKSTHPEHRFALTLRFDRG